MDQVKGLWRYHFTRVFVVATLLPVLLALVGLPLTHQSSVAYAVSGCQLNSVKGNIKHVIYVQFDNTHFTRDNPNVPSDLEQMPHLLNFIKSNGVLLTNNHTPLISHTSDDIITTLTGVYPAHHGVATAANSYQYYKPAGTTGFQCGFTYWTDSTPDSAYNLISAPPDANHP